MPLREATSKYELFDYQKDCVEFMLGSSYSICALEMGLGKTFVSLSVAERIKIKKCLIVCPSYLVLNWKNEIEKFFGERIVTTFKTLKDVYYPLDSEYCIVSYDIAYKSPALFEWAHTLILDEANALQSMKAKRTQGIHKHIFENSIPRVHLLTGTPIKNRIKEYYSLLALCNYNPNIADPPFLTRFTNDVDFADYFSFRKEFAGLSSRNKRFMVISWDGLRREDELREYLKGIYISKRSTLPKVNYKDVCVAEWDDAELRKQFDNYKLGQSLVAPAVKSASALKKAPLTVNYVKGLLEEIEGPIIVYTDHRESCYYIARHFNTPAITGEMPSSKRGLLAEKFQRGEMKVLVATMGSFSTGVNLTKSNLIVFNDFSWVPGNMAQAEFRINRLGQTRPCHVHRIIASEQDKYIVNTLYKQSEIINKLY